MNARIKAGRFVLLSALAYLALLAVTGELHRSSRALRFFALVWFAQAVLALWRAWHQPTLSDTSVPGDVPPAG